MKLNEWGLPSDWRDAVRLTSSVTIGSWDRVRVLFGWMPVVKTRTLTTVALGLVTTDESSVYLAAPGWWRFLFRRKRVGYVAEASRPIVEDAPQAPMSVHDPAEDLEVIP